MVNTSPGIDQSASETHTTHVGAGSTSSADAHWSPETHNLGGAAESSGSDQKSLEPHPVRVATGPTSDPTIDLSNNQSPCVGSDPYFTAISVWADAVDDLERTRTATANRIRALEDDKQTPIVADITRLRSLLTQIKHFEHQAELGLKRAMRQHPIWSAYGKQQVGVGEKQLARLLAAIGDPAARQRPSQLWAYCGLHVIDGAAPRRRRGMRANWSTVAKTRVYLIAESCVKNRTSAYRAIYDTGRERYADAVHSHDCPQCHAKAGDALKPGHQQARAYRLMMKQILLDLWVAASRGPTPRPSTLDPEIEVAQ